MSFQSYIERYNYYIREINKITSLRVGESVVAFNKTIALRDSRGRFVSNEMTTKEWIEFYISTKGIAEFKQLLISQFVQGYTSSGKPFGHYGGKHREKYLRRKNRANSWNRAAKMAKYVTHGISFGERYNLFYTGRAMRSILYAPNKSIMDIDTSTLSVRLNLSGSRFAKYNSMNNATHWKREDFALNRDMKLFFLRNMLIPFTRQYKGRISDFEDYILKLN